MRQRTLVGSKAEPRVSTAPHLPTSPAVGEEGDSIRSHVCVDSVPHLPRPPPLLLLSLTRGPDKGDPDSSLLTRVLREL